MQFMNSLKSEPNFETGNLRCKQRGQLWHSGGGGGSEWYNGIYIETYFADMKPHQVLKHFDVFTNMYWLVYDILMQILHRLHSRQLAETTWLTPSPVLSSHPCEQK